MKRFWILSLLLTCSLLASADDGRERVKGNGDLVTRTFQIDRFDQIDVDSSIEYGSGFMGWNPFSRKKKRFPVFNYMQTVGASTLQVTMDKNLFPYLAVEVEEGCLSLFVNKDNLSIRPTGLAVNGASPSLKKVSIRGFMNFVAESMLREPDLYISITGMGDIRLEDVACDTLKCQVFGMGNMYLAGKVPVASYEVGGMGKVHAFNCLSDQVDCEVSGIGTMELTVDRSLDAEISGIGKIRYKGNAEPSSSIGGLGRIKHVD